MDEENEDLLGNLDELELQLAELEDNLKRIESLEKNEALKRKG